MLGLSTASHFLTSQRGPCPCALAPDLRCSFGDSELCPCAHGQERGTGPHVPQEHRHRWATIRKSRRMAGLLQEAHGLRGREGQPGPGEGCVVLVVFCFLNQVGRLWMGHLLLVLKLQCYNIYCLSADG